MFLHSEQHKSIPYSSNSLAGKEKLRHYNCLHYLGNDSFGGKYTVRVFAGKEDCYFWREMNDAAFALRLQLLYIYKNKLSFHKSKIIRDL